MTTRTSRERTRPNGRRDIALLAGRRLQFGVLAAGVLATVLIAGSLAFTRGQTAGYQRQLERIDADLNQPLRLLDQTKIGYRRTQQTFETGLDATSGQPYAAILAQALTEREQAQRSWAEFKAMPPQFEGEEAARLAVDAAIAANNDVGQELGIAALTQNADPALVAQLTVSQQDAVSLVQKSLDTLASDFYVPELNREINALSGEAARATELILAGLVTVVVVGLLVTFIGYRRTTRFARAEARERDLQDDVAAENALDAQLQHALDMADTEDHVFGVIARALAQKGGEPVTDFLLADSATAPFEHAVSPADEHARRCPVSTPNECPVARHGQGLVFTDSHALDACSFLLERDAEPAAAVCTPVSIAGQTIGVVHEAYLKTGPPPHHRIRELEIIARKAGERLGMLRAFERSEAQAHTDPLTGLLNRRSLEDAVERLGIDGIDYTVAFADLDHFKLLNDTYGHDVGDRALRIFCTVLRTNVRPDDIVARYGGEEFVIVLPRCTPDETVPVLRRVQNALAETVRADGVPTFTVSIGVASTHQGGTFEEVLMIADGSLLHAKEQGRNRIVVAGMAEAFEGPPTMPNGSADIDAIGDPDVGTSDDRLEGSAEVPPTSQAGDLTER